MGYFGDRGMKSRHKAKKSLLGAHFLPELDVFPLLLLNDLFCLLGLLHIALPEKLQVISLVIVGLKGLFLYVDLSNSINTLKALRKRPSQ